MILTFLEYIFDILKILTHINLKKIRESKYKLIINNLDETNLNRFHIIL